MLFAVNAVINWAVSLPGILDPAAAARAFGGAEPNDPSVEGDRDVRGKAVLLKYNWIEKTITATVITLGWFGGDVPDRLMLLIVLTNWLWIPFILWGDLAVRRSSRTCAA